MFKNSTLSKSRNWWVAKSCDTSITGEIAIRIVRPKRSSLEDGLPLIRYFSADNAT